VIHQNEYAQLIEFNSTISEAVWVLTNVYAPCTIEGKANFLNWLNGFSLPDGTDWLLLGDFNLIRWPSDRNRLGGNVHEMLRFNEVLSNLGVEELSLQGNRYTWSNKQAGPLLELLDWFFASVSWIISYSGSVVSTLSRDVSDHHPCLVALNTDIPKFLAAS
jgi:endonuclease/exonuclease/phosphatase family metal-dependent hydrolase